MTRNVLSSSLDAAFIETSATADDRDLPVWERLPCVFTYKKESSKWFRSLHARDKINEEAKNTLRGRGVCLNTHGNPNGSGAP